MHFGDTDGCESNRNSGPHSVAGKHAEKTEDYARISKCPRRTALFTVDEDRRFSETTTGMLRMKIKEWGNVACKQERR